MDIMYDAIIVGAGPAGSIAAYVASKLGFKVLIIDRFRFPRFKPCGGGLTQKSILLLRSLGLDLNGVVRMSAAESLLLIVQVLSSLQTMTQ